MRTVQDCLKLAEKAPVLHRTTKQLLIAKISHLYNPIKDKDRKGFKELRENLAFDSLICEIRKEYPTDLYSKNARFTILQALRRLGLYD